MGRSEGGGSGDSKSGKRGPQISIGCFYSFLLAVVILVVAAVVLGGIWAALYGDHREDSKPAVSLSTKNRNPLPEGSVKVDAGYYRDELGWINNEKELLRGMESFYEKTGVMPYLYLTDSIDGETNPPLNAFNNFASDSYNSLFADKNGDIDQTHILVIFQQNDEGVYRSYYVAGVQAKAVIDDEAGDILLDYLDFYYSDQSLDGTEFLAKAFKDAGNDIMNVTHPNWYYPTINAAVLIVVVSIIGLVAVIVKKRREKAK